MKKRKRISQAIINKRFRRKLKSKEKKKKSRRSFQKNTSQNHPLKVVAKRNTRKSKPTKNQVLDYKVETKRLVKKQILTEDEVYYYDEDIHSEEFESTFKFYQQNLEAQSRYGIGKCCYYFADNDSINAAAIKKDNHYLVRIHKGLMIHMINMFKNNPELLNHQDLLKYSEFEEILDVPNHILMYQNAAHFVFYHELGHLIQFTSLKKKTLHEQLNNEGNFNLTNDLVEMDADEFAGVSMASHISQYFEKYREVENSDKLLNILVVLIVSSITLYVLSFQSNRVPLYFKQSTHPHPVIRVLSTAFTIISHLKELLIKHNIEISLNHVDVFKEALEVSQVIENEQWGSSLCELFKENVENNPVEIFAYIKELQDKRIGKKFMAISRRNKLAKKLHLK